MQRQVGFGKRPQRFFVSVTSGFGTNFAKTLLTGLLQLESEALTEPLTLVAEDNAGSRARPTVFCRVESRGVRMTPVVGKERGPQELYEQVVAQFGFVNPYAGGADEM